MRLAAASPPSIAARVEHLNLETNADLLQGKAVSTCAFAWGSRPARIFKQPRPDLIVACDVIYDEESVEKLALSFAALLGHTPARGKRGRDAPKPRATRALLSLPDRSEFGYTRGNDPEPLPDYELFLDALAHTMRGQLRVEHLDVIPSAKAGTMSSNVAVILLSRREPGGDAADADEEATTAYPYMAV